MKRLSAGLASVAAVTALAGCGGPGVDQLAAGPRGVVAEVRSGDAVVLRGGQVVRLVGVEAPKGDDLQDLPSKLVRVRGLLRPGSGEAVLKLDHPEQIEVLKEPK